MDLQATIQEMMPTLTNYAVRIIGVLFALWASFKIAGWFERRTTNGLKSRKFDATLSIFFGSLVRWLMLAAALLACLSVFGIETTSFAALLGAAGLAVGLAFQGTLGNFASGVMLLVFRPFSVGDLIKVGGELGIVAEIGLFVCALDTLDNRRVVIPNGAVTAGIIENMTANDTRRVDIDVGIAYDADLDKAREVLEKAAASVPGRHAELGHQVILLSLGASSVDWQVRVWCKTDDYWTVWDATVKLVKQALDGAKIEIPFTQVDLHVRGGTLPRVA